MKANEDATKDANKYFVRKYKKTEQFNTLNDDDKNLLDNLSDKQKAKEELEKALYENAMKINYLNQLPGVEEKAENSATDEIVNIILNYTKVEKPMSMNTSSTLKDFKVEAFKKYDMTNEKQKASIKFFLEKGDDLKAPPHAKTWSAMCSRTATSFTWCEPLLESGAFAKQGRNKNATQGFLKEG